MSLHLPGTPTSSGSFEVPLEMLAACHLRVAGQCATLRRLVPHLLAHGSDTDAQVAAAAVMRYFDTAAKDHHADEEADLFPALLESMAGSDAVCLRTLTSSLTAEHRVLEQQWRELRTVLARVAAGDAVLLDAHAIDAWIGGYERHIAREDAELLPSAARLLGDEALERIGRAMRERRGVMAP
jgi:hemerythrin-like domain-containing protein